MRHPLRRLAQRPRCFGRSRGARPCIPSWCSWRRSAGCERLAKRAGTVMLSHRTLTWPMSAVDPKQPPGKMSLVGATLTSNPQPKFWLVAFRQFHVAVSQIQAVLRSNHWWVTEQETHQVRDAFAAIEGQLEMLRSDLVSLIDLGGAPVSNGL